MEDGDHLEGDMVVTKEEENDLKIPSRNGTINKKYRWPNGTIPYAMTSNHSKEQQNYIENSLKKIESISCIKFVRRTNQKDYIQITVSIQLLQLSLLY